MDLRAACDDQFLYQTELDQEQFFDQWVPLIEKLRRKGCSLYVDEKSWESMALESTLLNPKSQIQFKELRSAVIRLLGKMELCKDSSCSGRATLTACLKIRVGAREVKTTNCDGVAVNVTFAFEETDVQGFWRDLLQQAANSGEFQQLIDISFWYLEFGPEATNCWNNTGHSFRNVRVALTNHLSYLNDEATKDWSVSGFSDSIFASIAQAKGVLLSRDESNAKGRAYADNAGIQQKCRHHTKLTPQNLAVSSHHGGRIYFGVENRTHTFVGKVCDHD